MTDFIELRGYRWPADDVQCQEVIWESVNDLPKHVYPHVTNWTAAVQAGGNCGVWANALAERFRSVYTFEPDPVNFSCLTQNVTQNVFCYHAALGEGIEAPICLNVQHANCGAFQVGGDGTIPVLTIDALRLPECGLIYLDVEGSEGKALIGARETIARCRPVIGIENKGLTTRFGMKPEDLHDLIVTGFNYRRVDKYGADCLYVPC